MKKATTKLLKPSIPSYKTDGCQFEVYDQKLNAMSMCGKELHNVGKIIYDLCPEHCDYIVALGKKVREIKKK